MSGLVDSAPEPGADSLIEALRGLASSTDKAARLCLVFDLAGPTEVMGLLRALRLSHAEAASAAALARLRDAIGTEHRLFRVAPDCHALLMAGATPDAGVALARRALSAFAQPLDCDGMRLPVAAAVGVLHFDPVEIPPESVLMVALTVAQDAHAAPDRVALREGVAHGAYRRTLALIEALPAAFAATDQLSLVYQPRLALSTRLCTRAEALLRWRHPVLGAVGPAEFVPLVEELGLSRIMTEWVIDQALSQVATWRAAGLRIGVAVNIAVPNLEETDFADRLAAALDRHGMQAEAIELELTESLKRNGSAQAGSTIAALKGMGIRLAIDDFGTGFSNLSDLRASDARILKIDRSFVRDITSVRRDREIVEGVVGLAHRLGYWVVAEGIETSEALELLADLGCDEGQGYFIARPMAPADLPTWHGSRLAAARQAAPGQRGAG